MFNGSNCDRKTQLSRILTEPLNRAPVLVKNMVSGFLRKILSPAPRRQIPEYAPGQTGYIHN